LTIIGDATQTIAALTEAAAAARESRSMDAKAMPDGASKAASLEHVSA
jgi:hypothetical protein